MHCGTPGCLQPSSVTSDAYLRKLAEQVCVWTPAATPTSVHDHAPLRFAMTITHNPHSPFGEIISRHDLCSYSGVTTSAEEPGVTLLPFSAPLSTLSCFICWKGALGATLLHSASTDPLFFPTFDPDSGTAASQLEPVASPHAAAGAGFYF